MNAANFGVPQRRKRVIIIGMRIDVATLPEEGNFQLHMGAFPGQIDHPVWFRKRHGMIEKGQGCLTNYKKPESFVEMLQQIQTTRRNQI